MKLAAVLATVTTLLAIPAVARARPDPEQVDPPPPGEDSQLYACNDHASMVELLVMLQRSFTGHVRDTALTAFAETKRSASPTSPVPISNPTALPKDF